MDATTDALRYTQKRDQHEDFCLKVLGFIKKPSIESREKLKGEKGFWQQILSGDESPDTFLSKLKAHDGRSWTRLLVFVGDDSPVFDSLKDLSPYHDCLMVRGGYGANEFGLTFCTFDTRVQLERLLRSKATKPADGKADLGSQVFFLPISGEVITQEIT